MFAAFGAVHGLLLIQDVWHPRVFLNTDRSGERLRTIAGLESAIRDGNFREFVFQNGNPGDYLPQGIVMMLSGQLGVIVLQVALALLAGLAVLRLSRHVGLGDWAARGAAGLYLALPHSLVLPHQLATEAIHTPLITISLWFLVDAAARRSARTLIASSLLVGVANLVRPITLLWPPVVALLLAMVRPRWRMGAAGHLAMAALPVLAWMALMNANTGGFQIGESSRDLGHNLYGQIDAIVAALPPDRREEARRAYVEPNSDGSVSIGEYLQFSMRHPVPVLRHVLRSATVFAGKSGIERLTIDYLELMPPGERTGWQDARSGWRRQVERDGALVTFARMWSSQPLVVSLSIIGAIAMTLLTLLYIVGSIVILLGKWVRESSSRFAMLCLVMLPPYIFLFSQVAIGMQSRHRAAAEPAMVILAVLAVSWIAERWGRRSPGRHSAVA